MFIRLESRVLQIMYNKHISEIHIRFNGHQDHLKLVFFLSTLMPILFPSFQLLLPLQSPSVCWGACSREEWKQRLVFHGKMDPFFLSETLKLSHVESIFWLSSMVKWPFLKAYLGHNYICPQSVSSFSTESHMILNSFATPHHFYFVL